MQKKILIVDDEQIIRESLCSDLRRSSYEADAVASGEEALVQMGKNSYGLLITDLRMGGMDGLELLRKTKEQNPDIPVIIITGYGELATAVDALRLGAADYLLKPYHDEELLIRIQNCFRNREMAEKIKIYEDILSICCECRKIRDDSNCPPEKAKWLTLEQYLHANTNVRMSHGYCPECGEKALNEIDRLTNTHKLSK